MYEKRREMKREKNEIKFFHFYCHRHKVDVSGNVVQMKGERKMERVKETITNVLFYGRVKSQNNKNEMLTIWNIDDPMEHGVPRVRLIRTHCHSFLSIVSHF